MSAVPGGAQGLLWFAWRPERLRWWFTIGIYQRTTAQWDACHLLSEFKPSSALRLLGLDHGAFLSSLSYRGVHFTSSQAPPNSRSVFLTLSCSPPATTAHSAPIMPCGCLARWLLSPTEAIPKGSVTFLSSGRNRSPFSFLVTKEPSPRTFLPYRSSSINSQGQHRHSL